MLECKKHPKYKAVYPPRADCEACWKYFKELHPTVILPDGLWVGQ